MRVATSDNLEQVITVGQGASLVSAREFYIEMEEARAEIKEEIRERRQSAKNYLFDHLDEALAKKMEQVRCSYLVAFPFPDTASWPSISPMIVKSCILWRPFP